jgi:hypothetical protein
VLEAPRPVTERPDCAKRAPSVGSVRNKKFDEVMVGNTGIFARDFWNRGVNESAWMPNRETAFVKFICVQTRI